MYTTTSYHFYLGELFKNILNLEALVLEYISDNIPSNIFRTLREMAKLSKLKILRYEFDLADLHQLLQPNKKFKESVYWCSSGIKTKCGKDCSVYLISEELQFLGRIKTLETILPIRDGGITQEKVFTHLLHTSMYISTWPIMSTMIQILIF
ncbi:hypothetical protein BDA99DRAFT_541785 [Phascolomyces articulosus]|uniref:Uncharacterized protein n=1 Tax=Phascolomyces articulosus TaxID=60185 RepID=A0AAD5P9X0_9FUNG|nr:hypothetical protein BDA99DRAFT_541785 [Phascolomyces articulosus]